jgi:CMP-N,N'-diacetyllegionaminic acid synthase
MMRTLGIVPARGGSKGVPRKNVRPLCGKPLLAYTAEAALAARRLTRIVLSTDDPDIAEVGRRCGLDVPFLRPSELAADDSPTLGLVQHALTYFKDRHVGFDAVCILQPTTPLRPPEYIDGCIALLEESGADAVVTIVPVPPEYNPHWVYFTADDRRIVLSTGESAPIPRRQDLPPAFRREGSVYVTRSEIVLERGSLFGDRLLGYEVDPALSVDINTPSEWACAERMLEARSS